MPQSHDGLFSPLLLSVCSCSHACACMCVHVRACACVHLLLCVWCVLAVNLTEMDDLEATWESKARAWVKTSESKGVCVCVCVCV